MPATLSSILHAADHEWRHWGRSVWNVPARSSTIGHRDDDPDFARYVIERYCAVGGGRPSVADIQDDRYFWSAVGMSAIMQAAGLTRSEFPFAQSHSVFIRHFINARRAGHTAAAFWGFRWGEPGGQPEPGDIVAYARGDNMTQAKALKRFDATSRYDSHTDVVVDRSGGQIEVIGCNVRDSVTRKRLNLGSDGHIADDQHFWFAVLKRRGG
jgi:hypothetical protein